MFVTLTSEKRTDFLCKWESPLPAVIVGRKYGHGGLSALGPGDQFCGLSSSRVAGSWGGGEGRVPRVPKSP